MNTAQFENSVLNALERVRNQLPAWTETIVFNGAGAAADYKDFGDGWTATIKSPAGYVGRVVGVSIYGITETFTATTTPSRVDVGSSSDSDAYYTGGSIGLAAAATPAHPVGTVNDYIPSNSNVIVKGVANTGGTPAGRSRVALTINWYEE